MTSVWFVVPAHGRVRLAAVCLRQLRRTCDLLADCGVSASAVVIADDENLDTALELGFGTVERENAPLGRKWNDGYELAAMAGVDFVVPLGSDDWIDPAWVLAQLEADGEVRCSRLSAVVSESGRHLSRLRIDYGGTVDFGDGVRMMRTALLKPLRYRPAEEDASRAIDTSVFLALRNALGRQPVVSFTDVHPLQIVDFKTWDEQLNPYSGCHARFGTQETDPWRALAAIYPAEAVEEMRAVYEPAAVAA